MRIELNAELCEGHAQCEILAPDYFEIRSDGKAHLLRGTVADSDRAMMEEVVMRCPVLALNLEKVAVQ